MSENPVEWPEEIQMPDQMWIVRAQLNGEEMKVNPPILIEKGDELFVHPQDQTRNAKALLNSNETHPAAEGEKLPTATFSEFVEWFDNCLEDTGLEKS